MATVFKHPENIKEPLHRSERKEQELEVSRFKNELKVHLSKRSSCPHVGEVISFPVNDGQAFYMIEDYETLIHLPLYDAWSIPSAHARGLRKEDIIENIKSRKFRESFIFRNSTNKVFNELVELDSGFYIKESFSDNVAPDELAEIAYIHMINIDDFAITRVEISFNFSTDKNGYISTNHIDVICMDGDHTKLTEAIEYSIDKINELKAIVVKSFNERWMNITFNEEIMC